MSRTDRFRPDRCHRPHVPRCPPSARGPLMKFRVERDVLADAAAWVARSLPARPPVPVLGGVLIEAVSGAGRRPAARLRVRLRDLGPRRAGRDHRRSRPGAGVRPAAGRHHPGAAVQAGGPGRRRVPGHDQLRQQPVQPADHAGRGLPAAAGHAAAGRHGAGGPAGRGGRPGRGGRRPRRHAADAHRGPAGDRRLPAHPGRHRPVPAGRARAGLVARRTPSRRPRC